MRNALATSIALVLLLTGSISAEYVKLGSGGNDVEVVVEESNNLRTVVRFEIGAYSKDAVEINGAAYYAIHCGEEPVLLRKGEPALPRLCRSLVIPDDAGVSVEVLSAQYTDFANTPVAPSKGNLPRSVNPRDVPYTFDAVYGVSEWYPGELASVRRPFIVRDYRGTVIDLNAFQYNPVEEVLRVYTSVTVEVSYAGPGLVNILSRKDDLKLVPDFDLTYRRRFINYDTGYKYAPVMESGDMLIITYDAFHTAMEPFIEWKRQKGIKTTIVDISTIGNNSTSIKDFIQSFYDDAGNNLAWVLLVGDEPQIATMTSYSGASDPSYVKLAGDDDYPDAFIGRFSAESVADVETQVARTISYEKQPAGTSWFHQGTGIASDIDGGHHGESDDEHMDLIRADLLGFTYTSVDQIYDPSGTASEVITALNGGRSIINYCGHGSYMGWGTTGFDSYDVDGLVNNDMLPFIISVACNNGEFDGRTCFAETWLRATYNGAPSGAVAVYMSSIGQEWIPPMDGQDEAIDLLVARDKVTFGGACFNGACRMIELDSDGFGVKTSDTWHIFGDPSVLLRTDDPGVLTVNHASTMFVSDTEFQVEVVGEEGAQCAIYRDGTLYGSAYTGPGGLAAVPLEGSLPAGENVTLTVTAFNASPYVTTVPVIIPEGPHVVFGSYNNHDSGVGNGNSLVEPGETIYLGLQLDNVGTGDALDVNAVISTLDTFVTIMTDSVAYGVIPAESSVYIEDGYTFVVAGDTPDGHSVTFDLEVTGNSRDVWTSMFVIPVHAPVIDFAAVAIDDAGGDGDGVFDPGETVELVVTLENSGSGQAFSVSAILTETDPYISVSDDYGFFGLIDSISGMGDNSGDVFEVTADLGCPNGYEVPVQLQVDVGACTTIVDFNLTIGEREVFYCDDFSFNQGWTGLGGSGEWTIGPATGGSGDDMYGYSDPVSDHTQTPDNMLLGNDLTPGSGGDYAPDLSPTQWVTSPVIDCSDHTGVQMEFFRWLGIEGGYDFAYLQVYDGGGWVTLFVNSLTLDDQQWVPQEYDLSEYADENPVLQIRFGIGPTDGGWQYCGWNIDDITLEGYNQTSGTPELSFGVTELDVTLKEGQSIVDTIWVHNIGDGELRVRFTSQDDWLVFFTGQNEIDPFDSLAFEVTVDASSLPEGDYGGSLVFTSNDNNRLTGNIPVDAHVISACCAGLTGDVDCSGADDPDISDMQRLIDFMFINMDSLCCVEEADVDLSGQDHLPVVPDDVDITDMQLLIDRIFINMNPLPPCP